MTVVYEQHATYTYTEEKISDNAFAKVALALSEKGVYICSSSSWGIDTPNVKYGMLEQESVKNTHIVYIDSDIAFTTTYRHTARDCVEELIENGFINPTYGKLESKSVKTSWVKPRGNALHIDVDVSSNGGRVYTGSPIDMGVGLSYDDIHMKLKPTLVNDSEGLRLKFDTVWYTEKVARKQIIEDTLVSIPLGDLGMIQSIVEKAIGISAPLTVDCLFDCKTHTSSECTPDIIAMRRKATEAASKLPTLDENGLIVSE